MSRPGEVYFYAFNQRDPDDYTTHWINLSLVEAVAFPGREEAAQAGANGNEGDRNRSPRPLRNRRTDPRRAPEHWLEVAEGRNVSTPNERPTRTLAPLTNDQIAACLEEVADLLHAQDANMFRVRAYRTAAATCARSAAAGPRDSRHGRHRRVSSSCPGSANLWHRR